VSARDRVSSPGSVFDDLEKRQLLAELQEKMFRRRERVQLGRYVLVERLGSGAMGVVYRAEDPQLQREVAVKVLHPQRADVAAGHERLRREARALGQVRHPNVIEVYDVGEAGARVFVAMALVEGRSLEAWLGEATRSWQEILDVFAHAGRGLHAAHQAGLVHRDFKPGNVQVGRDGSVRVLDFGLAKAMRLASATAPSDAGVDAHGSATIEGAVVGTPRYMAPAQLLGADADASSDQYAFCVALWEALFGEPPFDPEHMLASKQSRERAKLRAGSSVPSRIQRALRRGLSPEARDRFASMHALLEALLASSRRSAVAAAIAVVGVGVSAVVLWPRASPTTRPVTPAMRSLPAQAGLLHGRALAERDRVDEAIAALEAAHADAIAAAHDRTRFAIALELAGQEIQSRADIASGRRWAADARAVLDRLDPDPKLHFGLAQLDLVLARADGDGVKALAAARESVAYAREGWSSAHGKIAFALQGLGVAALEQQRFDEARAALHEAIAIGEKALPSDHPLPAYCLSVLAGVDAMEAAGDPALAERSITSARQAAAAMERALGADHFDAINARLTLGIALAEAGRAAEARVELQYAMDRFERARGPDTPGIAVAAESLGTVLAELGEVEQAEAALHRAVIAMETMHGEDYPPLTNTLTFLGRVQERRGSMDAARSSYERAVVLGPRAGPMPLAVALEHLAALERTAGKRERAAELYERAAAAWTELSDAPKAEAARKLASASR
jgi:tetratricopeptide (TPR) repeat protein/predicted Ser/Thr protein kinase